MAFDFLLTKYYLFTINFNFVLAKFLTDLNFSKVLFKVLYNVGDFN